jgi:O-acetyl-ADP-ribose deacetylase (regulator of RNase III)
MTSGNIFSTMATSLVNPVNCVGVMGAGLAKEFRRKYPAYYSWYKSACEKKEFQLGRVLDYRLKADHYIFSFPTKYHWKDKSLLDSIETGLVSLAQLIFEKKIRSVAIPALGCGLGELPWEPVKEAIETFSRSVPSVLIYLYVPISNKTRF